MSKKETIFCNQNHQLNWWFAPSPGSAYYRRASQEAPNRFANRVTFSGRRQSYIKSPLNAGLKQNHAVNAKTERIFRTSITGSRDFSYSTRRSSCYFILGPSPFHKQRGCIDSALHRHGFFHSNSEHEKRPGCAGGALHQHEDFLVPIQQHGGVLLPHGYRILFV